MPMVQVLCREWKWWLLIYTDNFKVRFLTFGPLLFSLWCFSVYFHFISLVAMQHRIRFISGLWCCKRSWNFATPEGFWPCWLDCRPGKWNFCCFSFTHLAWASIADLSLQRVPCVWVQPFTLHFASLQLELCTKFDTFCLYPLPVLPPYFIFTNHMGLRASV